MGVLAPSSAHARPSARLLIDTSGKFLARMPQCHLIWLDSSIRLLLLLLVLNFLHFDIQTFIQVKSSGQMEVKACERLIKYLVSVGLNIRVFATDRSTTIRTMMAAVYPWIKHQFDIW